MTNIDKIRITDLLMEREKYFVEVYESETIIKNILGQPYPGLTYYDIPSSKQKKTKKAKKQKAAKKTLIRRLKKNKENAYYVTYVENNEEKSSYQREHKVIQTLIDTTIPGIKIKNVSTVFFNAVGEVKTVDEIYHVDD